MTNIHVLKILWFLVALPVLAATDFVSLWPEMKGSSVLVTPIGAVQMSWSSDHHHRLAIQRIRVDYYRCTFLLIYGKKEKMLNLDVFKKNNSIIVRKNVMFDNGKDYVIMFDGIGTRRLLIKKGPTCGSTLDEQFNLKTDVAPLELKIDCAGVYGCFGPNIRYRVVPSIVGEGASARLCFGPCKKSPARLDDYLFCDLPYTNFDSLLCFLRPCFSGILATVQPDVDAIRLEYFPQKMHSIAFKFSRVNPQSFEISYYGGAGFFYVRSPDAKEGVFNTNGEPYTIFNLEFNRMNHCVRESFKVCQTLRLLPNHLMAMTLIVENVEKSTASVVGRAVFAAEDLNRAPVLIPNLKNRHVEIHYQVTSSISLLMKVFNWDVELPGFERDMLCACSIIHEGDSDKTLSPMVQIPKIHFFYRHYRYAETGMSFLADKLAADVYMPPRSMTCMFQKLKIPRNDAPQRLAHFVPLRSQSLYNLLLSCRLQKDGDKKTLQLWFVPENMMSEHARNCINLSVSDEDIKHHRFVSRPCQDGSFHLLLPSELVLRVLWSEESESLQVFLSGKDYEIEVCQFLFETGLIVQRPASTAPIGEGVLLSSVVTLLDDGWERKNEFVCADVPWSRSDRLVLSNGRLVGATYGLCNRADQTGSVWDIARGDMLGSAIFVCRYFHQSGPHNSLKNFGFVYWDPQSEKIVWYEAPPKALADVQCKSALEDKWFEWPAKALLWNVGEPPQHASLLSGEGLALVLKDGRRCLCTPLAMEMDDWGVSRLYFHSFLGSQRGEQILCDGLAADAQAMEVEAEALTQCAP